MPESCFHGASEKTLESIAAFIKTESSSALSETSFLSFVNSDKKISSVNAGEKTASARFARLSFTIWGAASRM